MLTGLSEMEIAATVHARFAGRPLRLFTRAYRETGDSRVPPLAATKPAPAEAGDGGSVCPTCDGDCVVPACTDPACGCELDPPCREVACPTCGGIGSV